MQREQILLVMTNYNQAQEVHRFLDELKTQWPFERMVAVDDGSVDGSDQLIEARGIKCIRHTKNRGVGAAIRTGIQFAHQNGYAACLLMSSNGKMDPREIETVIAPLLNGEADYITGSRFLNGVRSPGLTVFRRLSIPIFSWIAALAIGRKFSDITCGFRCYKIDFLFSPPLEIEQEWLNRYEMEYYIHFWACRLGIRIKEVPVTIRYQHLQKGRVSKIRPILDWWSMMRPLVFLRLGIRK